MSSEQDGASRIAGIYFRLGKALGTDRMVVVGGSAMKLTCDPDRPSNDIDLALPPRLLAGISQARLVAYGFTGYYEDSRLLVALDKESGIEVEVSSKNCGNLNQKIGLPRYSEESPTVLGISIDAVIDGGRLINVNGIGVRVPQPLHQLIMKYNLWLFRGDGKLKDQKDANDIRKIVRFYYGDTGKLASHADEIGRSCRARGIDVFMIDIKAINNA